MPVTCRTSWVESITLQALSAVLAQQRAEHPPPLPPPPTFRAFVDLAWPVLEPMTPFCDGYHIDAITAHLTAITEGTLQNLIINVPPRHSKSTLVAVLWPVW